MAILVTGGSGFIGSNLVAGLLARGQGDIRVYDLKRPPAADDFSADGVTYVQGDIRDRAALGRAMTGVDTVVHLAADTRVMDSIENPEFNFDVNVNGSLAILDTMRAAGVKRLVNASTGGAIIGKSDGAVHEAMAAAPLSPYGASKLAVEGYCSAYGASYGIQATSLRFSNVFGPRSYHKGSVVAAFFKAILAGEPLTIYGDGSQTRDYIFVEDICTGILAAIDRGPSGAVQLGSGVPTTLNALVRDMEGVVGRAFEINYLDARPGEVHSTFCNIARARSVLDFAPSTDLPATLGKTWDWFQAAYRKAG